MLIPVEWLREYVAADLSPEELAEQLTMAGLEVEEILGADEECVLDAYVTPNRGDWLSITGVAREVAALTGAEFQPPSVDLKPAGPPADVEVEIEAPDLCPRYIAHVIRGVRLGPSPEAVQRRLIAAGLRPVNNVVDVTNYVMLELGNPLHVFDLATVRGERIIVRRARSGERITVIDGADIALDTEMLVIADAERPVALAGIMGGRDTEVSEGTTDILLEAAAFDPTGTRRTAKRVGLATDSSYRYERHVDPAGTLAAARRAAYLLAEWAGGTVSSSVRDVYPAPVSARRLHFRPERCRQLLGVEVSDAHQERFLKRLGVAVYRQSP